MGRIGVQQHHVEAVADQLLRDGIRPSVERVRAALGTGSPNTITPLLDTWFKQLGHRLAGVPAGAGAITDLPLPVQNAFRLFWEQALQDAEAIATQNVHAQLQETAADRASLAQERAALDARRQSLEDNARLANRQAEDLRAHVADLIQKLRAAEAAAQLAQQHLTAAHSEVNELHERLAVQAKEHTSERNRSADRAAANERRLLQEIDRARQEASEAHAAVRSSEAAHATEVAALRVELNRASASHAEALQQRNEADARADARHRDATAAAEELQRVRRAYAGLEATLAAERQSASALASAISEVQARAASVDLALLETRSLIAKLRETTPSPKPPLRKTSTKGSRAP